MPRHIESKYPYGPKGDIPGVGTLQNTLEVLSVMAFVAGRTSRARLLPSVIVVPYRNPMLAAKILATIDQLSQGRLVVGCGVGWNLEEFQALMVPTPVRETGRGEQRVHPGLGRSCGPKRSRSSTASSSTSRKSTSRPRRSSSPARRSGSAGRAPRPSAGPPRCATAGCLRTPTRSTRLTRPSASRPRCRI